MYACHSEVLVCGPRLLVLKSRNMVLQVLGVFISAVLPFVCVAASNLCLRFSSGVQSLEEVCLQVTDLLPGLKKLRNLLPEHGCLLLSPGNFWQNDRERFNADPDIIKTIHQHEPKTLQTSATLKGKGLKCRRSRDKSLQLAWLFCAQSLQHVGCQWWKIGWHFVTHGIWNEATEYMS